MNRFFKVFCAWLCLAVMLPGNLSVCLAEEEKAADTIVVTFEAATIGYGYLLEPTVVSVSEGDTVATVIDRVLTAEGFSYEASGTVESGFYLKAIAPGGVLANGAKAAGGAGAAMKVPKRLGTEVPQIIFDSIKDTLGLDSVTDFDDGFSAGEGSLGEYDYSYMTGWMCSVNNVFGSTGAAETPVAAGDVLRIQYSMGWGSDLGPNWGFDYFATADKSALSVAMAEAKSADDASELFSDAAVAAAYRDAVTTAMTVDAAQADVDAAKAALNQAIEKFRAAQNVEPTPDEPTPSPAPTKKPEAEQEPPTGDSNLGFFALFAVLGLAALPVIRMARRTDR